VEISTIETRGIPAIDLISANFNSPAVLHAAGLVKQANIIIIGTPIYKVAYSGLLKVYLDLLPQDGFKNKIVLPIATGGSPAHFLAMDYALKPVISALGSRHILSSIYATDSQLKKNANGDYELDTETQRRIATAVDELLAAVHFPIRQEFADNQEFAAVGG
jgi:FMN reductase